MIIKIIKNHKMGVNLGTDVTNRIKQTVTKFKCFLINITYYVFIKCTR